MNQENRIISGNQMFQDIMNLTSFGGDDEMSTVWKQVVSKIGKKKDVTEDEGNNEISIGERMAINTRVVDLKNEILLVEANHSGWIQYLKMYQKFIIQGLNWALPSLKIKSLAFRLKGQDVKLSDSYDEQIKKDQKKMFNKIEEQQIQADKQFEKKPSGKASDLPEEFLKMFDKLRDSVEE